MISFSNTCRVQIATDGFHRELGPTTRPGPQEINVNVLGMEAVRGQEALTAPAGFLTPTLPHPTPNKPEAVCNLKWKKKSLAVALSVTENGCF